jgi:hypothetical protein
MATNIEVNPDGGQAVVYNSKGVGHAVNDDSVYTFALADGDFCSISDCPDGEDWPAFVEMMAKFWAAMWDKIRAEAQNPTATPV